MARVTIEKSMDGRISINFPVGFSPLSGDQRQQLEHQLEELGAAIPDNIRIRPSDLADYLAEHANLGESGNQLAGSLRVIDNA